MVRFKAIETLRRFSIEEFGASAVEFCVVTAAVAGLGVAVIGAMQDSAVDNAEAVFVAGAAQISDG